ncbi:MAG: flagellar motor protein MotA, partial [Pseudomonadota bacterium]
MARALVKGNQNIEQSTRDNTEVVTNLTDGIQGLVQNMRTEQQLVRNWMEAQAEQQAEIKLYLSKLSEGAAEKDSSEKS